MTTTYERDGNGRLTNMQTTSLQGVAIQGFAFTYDGANNIKSRNNNQYAYDELNRLIGAKVEGNFHDDYPAKKGYITEDFFGQKLLDFAMDQASRAKLDYAGASVGVDLGLPVQNIDRITLRRDITGNAPQNRTKPSTFDVYYQDADGNFAKVDPADWEMRDDGRGTYTVFLKKPIEARVVKVHSKYNDRGEDLSAVNKATFVNDLGEAIDVEPKVNEAYMQYEYDAAGNRITQYFTVVLTHETHYRYYANSNRLLTDGKWAYVYDANGNLVKKGNQYQIIGEQVTFTTDGLFAELWEYGYDLLNRLVAVKKNGVQVGSYVYDPTGLRAVKHGTKGETHYTFDLSGNAIYEKDVATGQERSYIWVGGQHFARLDGGIGGTGEKYFYHTDHEGSLTAVTDITGIVVWRSDNLPFGGKIEQDKEYAFAEARGFIGKEWDEDTGLYYFNARWYDSELGRFISEDPLGDPNNPNLYVYSRNNPLRFIDPSGFWTYEVDLDTGDLVAIAERGDTLSEMDFYYDGIAADNDWKNPDLIHEGDSFSVKQLDQEGIVRRSEIFEDQMKKFDPGNKSDHDLRTQLHDFANAYSIWARNEQTTAKEALASIMDYRAYLRNHKDMDAYVTDLSLVITGVERLQVQGLTRATTVEDTQYMVPFFGGSGFKPENALNPEDNQARHFIGYLLAAKEVGIRAPLGSYVRERGNQDQTQDINLAWAAYHFWNTYSYRNNPHNPLVAYDRACGAYPLQGAGDWVRGNL